MTVALKEFIPLLMPGMPSGFELVVDGDTDSMMMVYGDKRALLFTRAELENHEWKAQYARRIDDFIKQIWGLE